MLFASIDYLPKPLVGTVTVWLIEVAGKGVTRKRGKDTNSPTIFVSLPAILVDIQEPTTILLYCLDARW